MKGYLLNIFFLLLFQLDTFSQSTTLFTASNYNSIDNHSVVNIRTFFKDKYGFVWIASQDGLLRSDGKNSVLYSKDVNDKRHKLLSNDVDAIVADNNENFIWVLSSYGGIVKIDIRTGGVLKNIVFTSPELPGSSFYFRGIEKEGNYLFVLSEEGYLFKINTLSNTWKFQKLKISNNDDRVEYFYKLNDLFVIFINGKSVLLYDYKSDKILDNQNSAYSVYTKSGVILHDTLFVGTNNGIHKVFIKQGKLILGEVNDLLINQNKIFSVGVFAGKLIFSVDDYIYIYNCELRTFIKLCPSSGLEKRKWYKNIIAYLFFENSLWLGNELGLSIVKLNSAFTPFYQDLNSAVKLSHCYGINALNDSSFIVACADGVYNINPRKPGINQIIKNGYYLTSFRINKSIIVSGLKGTFIMDNNSLKKISTKFSALKILDNDVLIEPAFYKDSLIILASQISKGLYIFDQQHAKLDLITLESKPVKLQNLNINKLFFDSLNRLWILTDNLISIYNLKEQTLVDYTLLNPVTNEPLNIIKDICYAKGDYFIAAYGMGVFRINDSMKVIKYYSATDGLQNTNLYKILLLNDSLLITSSNYGLYSINMYSNQVKQYTEQNGLHSNFFEQYSSVVYDNQIFFGGINGVTKIDPKLITKNKNPPLLLINQIVITDSKDNVDSSNLEIKKISVSNMALQTKIIFSAINWSDPDGVTYQYRIVERSKEWINLNTQNFVTLIGLSPGTYHLQVKAANEDGVWSEPKELVLEFLPKWYQTWWFKLLIFLTTAGIIYAFYRYRIAQIKKQHEIRKNIATDLHDDLGSTLNSVKVFTNLAIRGVNQDESLQQIKDNLSEATSGLRDMIWVLDDSLDTVDELITRLKQFAIPVATASNIETDIFAEKSITNLQLTKEEKRNLFLVCKEAINNSIKYSGASNINISILPAGKKIKIAIADNGKGFDATQVKKGYGLKNMQYRAGQVKYTTTLTSAPGKGTQVEIKPV